MIQHLSAEAPVGERCELFDCPRSTYYYQSVRHDDSRVLAAIEYGLMRCPWFGYRRVVAQLNWEGIQAGETVVRRLLKALEHSHAVGQVRVHTTDSNHAYTRYSNMIRGLTLSHPNQLWVADMTYIRLGTKFMYLAVILDAFTRSVRGWALSRSLSQELTLTALRMALAKAKPFIFHADQGSQ
jgi:putative transposase